MAKKDKNNQNINSIPKYQWGNLISMPMFSPPNTETGKKQRQILSYFPITDVAIDVEKAGLNPTKGNITAAGATTLLNILGGKYFKYITKGSQEIKQMANIAKDKYDELIKLLKQNRSSVVNSRSTREEAYKLKKQAEQAFSDYDAYNRIYNIQKVPEYFLYSIWPFMDAGINHAQNNIDNKKQGGKMNILEFLKNGSGIHIKEKNKGKFTSYCGGKVTDECIRKAKASGNPTLVKRATFAQNARRWKHKEGGKAFVTGINILDSNPKAYKEVKKKYKMRSAQQGTKMNFFQKANNFLNSDLGKGLSNSLINGIGNIVFSAKATKAQNEALDAQLKAHKAKTFVEKYNENLQNQSDKSPIVRQSNAWNQANSQVSSENNFEKEINKQKLINEEFAKQAQADAWYTTTSNIAGTAINALNKNGVPKTASSPSYFDNYVNTKYKKFGTFNPDGSMNMLGGTFTIKDGYKPNQPQLFNYQPLKLNI